MILAVPRRVDFWINSILVVTPISFRYCSSLSVTVPRAPITIGMTLVDTFQIFLISLARSWYFMIFSCSLFRMFTSAGMATSKMIVSFEFLSTITMPGLLACISISVCVVKSHNTLNCSISATLSG